MRAAPGSGAGGRNPPGSPARAKRRTTTPSSVGLGRGEGVEGGVGVGATVEVQPPRTNATARATPAARFTAGRASRRRSWPASGDPAVAPRGARRGGGRGPGGGGRPRGG